MFHNFEMRILLSLILFLAINTSYSQVRPAKRALKQLEKGNLVKSAALADRALARDSLLPAALYAKSSVLIDTANATTKIDSAYHYILKARQEYTHLDKKSRKKHVRAGTDSMAMEVLKHQIDSIAFERAKDINSEASFIYFLEYFNTAKQVPRAISMRNSLAYASARAENTYQSYLQFMEKYPDATQVEEAKRRYEKLYFKKSTSDGKLESYIKFLKDHPDTPYRTEAEENIYEVMTADNSAESYTDFIRQFPDSKLKSRAVDFLYHVLKEEGKYLPKELVTDSLARIITVEDRIFIPVYENDKYGFIDAYGVEIIPPTYDEIFEDELCGGIDRDYMLVKNKIVAPDKTQIYRGEYDIVEDLGYGFLKIGSEGRFSVVHKSGKIILPGNNENVKLLKGKFLAFKRNKLWGVRTISGREIINNQFSDVIVQGPFYIFEKDDLAQITNQEALVAATENNRLSLGKSYDDYELVNEAQMWLRAGNKETVIDSNLKEIIPYASQKIKLLKEGFVIDKQEQLYVLNKNYKPIDKEPGHQVKVNDSWVALKNNSNWHLYDLENNTLRSKALDSLYLLGDYFAVAYKNDSVAVITRDKPFLLMPDEKMSLISAVNAGQYLLIEDSRKKRIINQHGQQVFNGQLDDAKALGPHFIVISQRGKRGILSDSAEVLLKTEYDAIANYNDGYVSLLKNRRFGLYSREKAVFIPAEYEKNIQRYNDHVFVAEKDDKLGLVNKNNKHLSAFTYNEVKFWTDSVALVKNDLKWSLYNIYQGEIIDEGIKSIQVIAQNSEEQIAVILRDTGYGVISSIRGEVISATYNDLINVGSASVPVYFAEKRIAEAELYVVIYYNKDGKAIRKQTFETADYPLIYCDN